MNINANKIKVLEREKEIFVALEAKSTDSFMKSYYQKQIERLGNLLEKLKR